jgi:Immunity protein 74
MFFVPKVNVIASDEGFSVEVLGRTGIEYREGDRAMFVDSEVLAAGHGIAIFKASLKCWKPPHDTEPLSDEKKREILRNISSAIGFRKQPVEIL